MDLLRRPNSNKLSSLRDTRASLCPGQACVTSLSQPTREVYFKYYWYFPTGFDFTFAAGKHFWRISSGDLGMYGRNGQIDTQTTGGGNGGMDVIYIWSQQNVNGFLGAATLPAGRWFEFEFYARLNDPGVANGEAKVWVDRVPMLNQTNVNLGATNASYNILQLTTNYDNCTGVCYWYMDDVEVWNGCPSGSSCNAGSSPVNLAPPSNLRVVP